MTSLILPSHDGGTREYRLQGGTSWARPTAPLTARRAYAAAHVIPEVLADNTPGAPARLDWEATMAYRHELWSYGLGVADAMDTAQRGMGLDWAATQQLIKRTGVEAASVVSAGSAATAGKSVRDLVSCGAGTDQLDIESLPAGEAGLKAVLEAYREQIAVITEAGPKVIIMASRALAKVASGPEDYLKVYSALLQEVDQPVILHWLGTMFDPALAGYWGSDDVAAATETFLGLIKDNAAKVDGVKVSLLDASHEVALRAALPESVRLYTGDDFNYPELIDGDGQPPLGRAAGHLCGHLPRRFGGPAELRRRQHRQGPRNPGLHPRTGQAHLQRPHVLLQDRDRFYVLAQRQAAGLPDGGRPALRPFGVPLG
ncbi:hypothetical protein RKD54_001575 [Pseudarthrobacter sp. SLBN-100]